jgi:hypothetical protein
MRRSVVVVRGGAARAGGRLVKGEPAESAGTRARSVVAAARTIAIRDDARGVGDSM